MSITVGRKHGNGYHDNVYCKIIVKHSKSFRDLLEYESNQLKEHSGVIYDRDFVPSWIKRVCMQCPVTYPRKYMKKKGDIFVCLGCGLIKVPRGVEYKKEKKENG